MSEHQKSVATYPEAATNALEGASCHLRLVGTFEFLNLSI